MGVGDASQEGLGHAAAVLDIDSRHRLLIDCGPGVLASFTEKYHALPDALFITHCHLDHIADFEKLFIKAWFSDRQKPLIKLFVPVAIIPLLHERVATYPGALAEGGVNFWDAFQLVPVSSDFEFAGERFQVLPVRHHRPLSAFGLYLEDKFFYTGDTRPIPELLTHEISEKTQIFHDCSIVGNPSHSGLDDLLREYNEALLNRLFVYHYHQASDREQFEQAGLSVVLKGQEFLFTKD